MDQIDPIDQMDDRLFCGKVYCPLGPPGPPGPLKRRFVSKDLLPNLFEFDYTPLEKSNTVQPEKMHMLFL